MHFSNISCNKATESGIVIQGFPEKKITNISLNNIEIKSAKNAISNENADNVLMMDVFIGKRATVPTAAK